jgi:phosphoribosylformylglycinamidine (FGAM) synthase-like amidotransferase family enzyme
MLIAMGGPMSVNDEVALPWLKAEKQAVREAIAMDKLVLGVCLGVSSPDRLTLESRLLRARSGHAQVEVQ